MGLAVCLVALGQDARPPQAHFHHVHLNSVDPAAAEAFYKRSFEPEAGLRFEKVPAAPPSDILSPIWHIGWGAENMPEAYQRQLAAGTRFETPITDISGLVGQPPNSGKFFYAYVDGPDHALIELNTANHHRFGHVHLLSKDPVAAAEWYEKNLGIPVRSKSSKERIYEGFPVSPSASLQADYVNIIIFPMTYAKKQWPDLWNTRDDFETSQGRVIDHLAFTIPDLPATLARLKSNGVRILTSGNDRLLIEGPDHILLELLLAP